MVVRRAAQIAAAAPAMVGLASAAYQRVADVRDRRRYPPPGELVDIGGRRLHLWRMGAGGPTVVIEPFLGGLATEWAHIQRALATDTTVVTYDRAGLGWSDPARQVRTVGLLVTDLHRLLAAAQIPPPYVLVGHSFGGILVRVYQARYPEQVAGLVLAEASHPDQRRRLGKDASLSRQILRALKWERPWGLRRLGRDLGVIKRPPGAIHRLSPELADAAEAIALTSNSLRADVQEMLFFAWMASQARAELPATPGALGALPLTVVTSSEIDPDLTGEMAERRRRVYPTWLAMQKEMAALSARSTHLIAERAGHFVHRQDPELVVRAIRDQLQQHRAEQ